jgi:hypothetical protein
VSDHERARSGSSFTTLREGDVFIPRESGTTVALSRRVSLIWRLALAGLLLVVVTALAAVALSAGSDLTARLETSASDRAR